MSGTDHISGKALLYGTGKPGWAQLLPKQARVLPSPEDKAAACCMCYVCLLLCVPYQTVSMGNYVCACLLALRAAPRGGVPCSRRPAWRERLHPQTAPGKQRQPALRPTPRLSLLGVLLSADSGDSAWLSAPGITGAGLGPVEGGLWHPTLAAPG